MLYFAAIWLLLLPLTLVWGTSCLYLFDAVEFRRLGDRLIAAIWLGLVGFAVLLMALSLKLPLTPGLAGGLAGGLTVLSLISQNTRIALRRLWLFHVKRRVGFVICAILLMAVWMSQSVVWGDTGYYHGSAIQWFAQYGSVPGVALIFSNLGFTSSWFALAAPFNPGNLVIHASAVMNGFVGLMALIHLALVGKRITQRQANRSDWFMGLFLMMSLAVCLLLSPFKEIFISPSPDLPILYLVGTIAWAMLVTSDPKQQNFGVMRSPWVDGRAVPLALAAGAVTIKLTAIPALLVTGFFFWIIHRLSLRRLMFAVGLVTLILLPNILSSIVTSGCPLYPSAVLCLDLPWSPTPQAAHQIAANTHDWVSWYGTPPEGANPWIWALGEMMKSKRDRISLLLLGFTLASSLYIVKKIFKQRREKWLQREIWVAVLGISGMAFLLATSVFFRFMLPYVFIILALVGSLFGQSVLDKLKVFEQLPQKPMRQRSLYLLVTVLTIAVVTGSVTQQAGANLLLPTAMKRSEVIQKVTNDITYTAPKSGEFHLTMDNQDDEATKALKQEQGKRLDRCWAAAIPCSYDIPKNVYLRDAKQGVRAGFERRPRETKNPVESDE